MWHLFAEDNNASVIENLTRLLERHGVSHIQTRSHELTFPAGTRAGDDFYSDIQHLFSVSIPFFHKWARLPADYNTIYQQMLKETRQPDFVGRWTMLTAWGTPSAK